MSCKLKLNTVAYVFTVIHTPLLLFKRIETCTLEKLIICIFTHQFQAPNAFPKCTTLNRTVHTEFALSTYLKI
jgi:hypothetical protein